MSGANVRRAKLEWSWRRRMSHQLLTVSAKGQKYAQVRPISTQSSQSHKSLRCFKKSRVIIIFYYFQKVIRFKLKVLKMRRLNFKEFSRLWTFFAYHYYNHPLQLFQFFWVLSSPHFLISDFRSSARCDFFKIGRTIWKHLIFLIFFHIFRISLSSIFASYQCFINGISRCA